MIEVGGDPSSAPADHLVRIWAWLQIFRMPNKILTEILIAVNLIFNLKYDLWVLSKIRLPKTLHAKCAHH